MVRVLIARIPLAHHTRTEYGEHQWYWSAGNDVNQRQGHGIITSNIRAASSPVDD